MKMHSKKGFTLLEMVAALAVVGGVGLMTAKSTNQEHEQLQAKAMGKEIYEYNIAVNRYLADLSNSLTTEEKEIYAQNAVGSKWLKSSTCDASGTASQGFLPCQALPADRTIYGNSQPATSIYYADGDLRAKTSWSNALFRGKSSEAMMGLAALVATGSYVHHEDNIEQEGSTLFCPDIASYDAKMQSICEGSRGKVVSFSSASASAGIATGTGTVTESDILDQYLSTEGKNAMRNILEFNDTGEPTDHADIPNFDNTTLRQIVNVSRIFNVGDSGNDSLILGNYRGDAIYTDEFITSNNLLQNSVIVDGDLAISGGVMVDGNISSKILSTGQLITDKIKAYNAHIGGSIYANTAEIDNIRTYGDITIKEGSLKANELDVAGDAYFSGTMRVAQGLNADTITTNSAVMDSVETSHLSVSAPIKYSAVEFDEYSVIIGDTCTVNGSLTAGRDTSAPFGKQDTLAICDDGKWIKAVRVTGGVLNPSQTATYTVDSFYTADQFKRRVSYELYSAYEATTNSIRYTKNDLKCSEVNSYVIYKGDGKFQCITT